MSGGAGTSDTMGSGHHRRGTLIRPAQEQDAPVVLAMFDEVIAWFTEIGNTGQWGTTPFSNDPKRVKRVTDWCAGPGSWLDVDVAGNGLAALVLGDAHDYVPAADAPELYVKVLIASRAPGARGAGRRLLAFADEQARHARVHRLRVDCYAGGSGRLIAFYESCGYQTTETFTVGDWPGQILIKPVTDSPLAHVDGIGART